MKLNSRTNRLKLVMGGLLVCLGLVVFFATRPQQKSELVWRLLSTTQTNGAWLAEMELENLGTRDALVVVWNLGHLSKIEITDDQAFGDVEVAGPLLKRIAPRERIRIPASMDSRTHRWSLHTLSVHLDPETKLALWMYEKGWIDSLPDFLKSFLGSRMQDKKFVVNGGPFTNSTSLTR